MEPGGSTFPAPAELPEREIPNLTRNAGFGRGKTTPGFINDAVSDQTMTQEDLDRHIRARQSRIAHVLKKPDQYKVCDQCRGVVPKTMGICPFCATYRFNEEIDYLKETRSHLINRQLWVSKYFDGLRGATRAHIRSESVTEEQRSRPSKVAADAVACL